MEQRVYHQPVMLDLPSCGDIADLQHVHLIVMSFENAEVLLHLIYTHHINSACSVTICWSLDKCCALYDGLSLNLSCFKLLRMPMIAISSYSHYKTCVSIFKFEASI
ncbi:hypothetical protein ABFS83_10G111100 [Erythranthe nasuta]